MALKDNIKFTTLQKEVNIKYESIIKDSQFDLEEKKNKIANLLKIDNTNEKIVFEFLKLQNSILAKSKDDSLKKILLQYEYCIEEKKFNENFQMLKVTKISYKKRIMNLISLIKEYKNKNNLDDKVELLDKIEAQNVEKFHNTFPINYNVNLELFFYSLYELLCKQILSFYKNNIVTENDIKDHIMDPTIKKSQLLFNNKNETNEQIKMLDKKLKYIPFICGTFNNSMSNLSDFIIFTNENFLKRFESDELKEEKEILLFTDYLFFLSLYPFTTHVANEYMNIWNDTLSDMSIEDKIKLAKSFSINHLSFKLDNNILTVENDLKKREAYSIKNVEDYSFITLIHYLFGINRKPDSIELDKFLKIDKYNEKLYIKKIWKTWEEFLVKVLSSNMVKSVFNKIFDDAKNIKDDNKLSPYLFFDKEEIKLIINNSRYYIFNSDFYGITLGKNLLIYYDGEPYLIRDNPLLSKISFLSNNVKSNLHEIVGHLNIRFQYYLSKDKRYISSKPNKPSSHGKSREGKEAEEYIEELIFGGSELIFTTEQMLYILDIKNYEKDYLEFREEFIKCGLKKGYKISEEFKILLKQLDINSDKISFESNINFNAIKSYKNIRGNIKSVKHPIDIYNDIYD